LEIIGNGQSAMGKWVPRIYNFSNEGIISWFEFAQAIKEIINCPCDVKPIRTAEYPTPAKRPAYSVLDKTKIQETFGVQLKDWKESLKICIEKIQRQ
jgi:dTDP-4-dehydrorhamnose reductase